MSNLQFIELNLTIPDFQKPSISLPSISSLSTPAPPALPNLELKNISSYNHNIEAFLNAVVSDFQQVVDNALSTLSDSAEYEIEHEINFILSMFKFELLKLQERYYSEIRSARDKLAAVSQGIPSGSALYIYNRLIEASIIDTQNLYVNTRKKLFDAVRQTLSIILERLLSILRVRDQVSDEIDRVIGLVRGLDFSKQSAIISNILDYHNTLVDLYALYAETLVMAYSARLSSLLEAEAKAQEILNEIRTAEIDNSLKTIAEEVVLLNIDRNVLEQRAASLEMYEEIKKLEEYEAILSKYNADIRRFAAEVDRAFMPYRVFSRQMDVASARVSAEGEMLSADRIRIGTARMLIDADFDLKSATYEGIRGELSKIRGEIAKKEAKIRKAIERARAVMDTEYFSKLLEYIEELKYTQSEWIERVARDERSMRLVTMANEKAIKLYQLMGERDAITAMRTDASHLLGVIDKAGEIVRAGVVGCSQVTAEIVRAFGSARC